MRKSLFAVLCSLALSGCIFGGEGDNSTTAKTDPTANVPTNMRLSPGVYVANYPWLDTTSPPLESELILDSSGAFRMFWIQSNQAFYDAHGTWDQRDSNLLLQKMDHAFSQSGMFRDYTRSEDDTNALLGVTDTSFFRREYSPVRQKPLWIGYVRRSFPSVKDGGYLLAKTYPQDSGAAVSVKFTITLDGPKFFLSIVEDTLESFQASAKWYQVGSFLATEENLQRQVDSTRTFPAWDTLGGLILKRMKAVSDTTFYLWNPESFFDTASWDPYRRI